MHINASKVKLFTLVGLVQEWLMGRKAVTK